MLVVGAGDIGRTIGRMLAGFDVELTYVARTAREGVRSTASCPELLPHADVVILIVPVTPETTGMVDAAFLAAMTDGALLVNAARGVVVDTDALLAELTAGRLRAALDVTDPEPLPDGHPLWSAPGLLLTPHVGGSGAGDQRPGRRGGHRPGGPHPGRASRWSTSSTGTEAAGGAGTSIRPPDSAASRGRSRARMTGSRTSVPPVVTSHRSPRGATRMPASSAHATRRCPASERTVRPSSPTSTPTRSTQSATRQGDQQQDERPRVRRRPAAPRTAPGARRAAARSGSSAGGQGSPRRAILPPGPDAARYDAAYASHRIARRHQA